MTAPVSVDATAHPTGKKRGTSLAAWLAGSVAATAFGPYLIGGLRTEQAFVYGIAGIGLTLGVWIRMRLSLTSASVLALLLLQWMIAVIGAAWPPLNGTPWPLGSLYAGIDNLTLPIATLLAAWMITVQSGTREPSLRAACTVLVFAACVNSCLALASEKVDLTWLFSHFWTSQGYTDNQSVAGRSEQLGRLTGLINQPMEAGAIASMALLATIYLYRERPWKLVTTATLVTVGGILSVSKIFILGGFPIGLWMILRITEGRHRRLVTLAAALAALYTAGRLGYLPSWSGSDYLLRLFVGEGNRSAVDLYTAGRLGGASTLNQVWRAVIDTEPWFGFGAAGLATPADNGWIQSLMFAGLIGVAVYTAVLLLAGWSWLRTRAAMTDAERSLTGGLVLVLIFGSLGGPMLTVNRAATIAWLLLGLTLLSHSTDTHPSPDPRSRSSRRGMTAR